MKNKKKLAELEALPILNRKSELPTFFPKETSTFIQKQKPKFNTSFP